ncbi:MAG: hypothetical protein Q9182_007554, partial [Xanthomendoza sp. 2 TL-2023]
LRTERRYQLKRFKQRNEQAVDTIGASNVRMQQSYDSSQLPMVLKEIPNELDMYRKQLETHLDSHKIWLSWQGTKIRRQLKDRIASIERMRTTIGAISRLMSTYATQSTLLDDELGYIKSSFRSFANDDALAKGVIALPFNAQTEMELTQLTWPRSDWRLKPIDADRNAIDIRKRNIDNFHRIHHNDVASVLSQMRPMCNSFPDRRFIDGGFLFLCNVWNNAQMFSGLDDDLLDPKSWARQHDELRHLYKKKIRADQKHVDHLISIAIRDAMKGKQAPEFMD